MSMIATRSTHYGATLGAAMLHARTPPVMMLHQRRLHTPSPLRQEVQGGNKADDTLAKPSSSKVVMNHQVAEEVLKDQYEPGWAMHHPRYTDEDLKSVKVVNKKREGFGDWVAATMVAIARTGFDLATRYPKHVEKFPRIKGSDSNVVKISQPLAEMQRDDTKTAKSKAVAMGEAEHTRSSNLPEEMELGEMRKRGLCYGPEAWLVRICFLESVAGVPGMVAASVRHLHSLRLLRRDKGWINSLLQEAANERQHLLTALKLYKPGKFMRLMLLFTQGIFYNFFFIFYLISPRVAHRFVGFLEEEAVLTYTRVAEEIAEGRLPEWENYPAPQIAIDYWYLKKDAKMIDVILAIRADEAGHRMVNNTLAGLKSDDYNPFAYADAPPSLSGTKWGLDREEAVQYFEKEDAARRAKSHTPKHTDAEGPFAGRDGTSA